jgi:hypothetical protein
MNKRKFPLELSGDSFLTLMARSQKPRTIDSNWMGTISSTERNMYKKSLSSFNHDNVSSEFAILARPAIVAI